MLFVGAQAAAAGLGAVGAAAAAVAGARPNGLAALCLGAWGAAEAAAVLWERLRQDAAPGAALWGGSYAPCPLALLPDRLPASQSRCALRQC